MLSSAIRIALPGFDSAELQKMLQALCSVDGDKWLPKSRPGSLLHLRLTMICIGDCPCVQRPKELLLYVIGVCLPSYDTLSGLHQPLYERSNGASSMVLSKQTSGLNLITGKEDTVGAWHGSFGFAKVGAEPIIALPSSPKGKQEKGVEIRCSGF